MKNKIVLGILLLIAVALLMLFFFNKKTEAAKPISGQTTTWNIEHINAPKAWENVSSTKEVKIGILSSGISTTHPDLIDNVKGGINILKNSNDWNDKLGYGSASAGIVGAINNDIGVVGVDPNAQLYAIKFYDDAKKMKVEDAIKGIEWAINNKMDIILADFTFIEDYPEFHNAIKEAKNSGIIIITNAGASSKLYYPAKYPEVITVGSIDKNNEIASWSYKGPEVDFVLPGVSIRTTNNKKGYISENSSGPAFASAHIAGIISLILKTEVGEYDFNSNDQWDQDEVYAKMKDATTDLGVTGFDNTYGWGLVDAYEATK